ncbi:hypothetical protein TNCT_177101, partial [Trichonephila clavata]
MKVAMMWISRVKQTLPLFSISFNSKSYSSYL